MNSPAPADRRPGLVSTAIAAMSAGLGFGLVALVGLRLTPWPEDFDVTVKLPYVEEHAGDFNAILIGSSEVFRSYVPKVIDERMARDGLVFRSFNMAAPGMFSFETDFVLRRVLATEGLDLDYVLLQPGDWDPRPKSPSELENMFSNRSVHWHDTRQLMHVLQALVETEMPFGEKLTLARAHTRAWAWKLSSYGQGRRILKRLAGRPLWEYQPITRQELEKDRGYQALEDLHHPAIRVRRRLLLDDPDGYEDKIRTMQAANAAPLPAEAYCRTRLADQIELVRALGAEPIFVAPPSSIEAHHALRLAEEGAIRLIAFNDPELYPELYSVEAHFDPNHLNASGAARFSPMFANELARELSEKP